MSENELQNELQNEAGNINESEVNGVAERPQGASDLAPESEAEHEQKPQEAAQEAINKRIGKATFKARQAERERDQALQELNEYKAKQEEELARQVENIPPMPDVFDDDYEQKVAARDDAIKKQAEYRAQQNFIYQQQEQVRLQNEQAQQAQLQDAVKNYSERAVKLGIDASELQSAGNAVAHYEFSPELEWHILNDPDGPLLTKYLAANSDKGQELASMPAFGVDRFLDSIRAEASVLKPKQSAAPKPSQDLQGGATPPDGLKFAKGGTFE
jgi:hypothetical protein